MASMLTGLMALSAAEAQSLTGEQFLGAVQPRTVHCDSSATDDSRFTYFAGGIATGPHVGTFTEEGKVTVGPHTTPAFGTVLRFKATFTITNEQGQPIVHGKKRLITPLPVTASSGGACLPDFPEFPPTIFAILEEGNVCYEANIAGHGKDQGITQVLLGFLPTIGANLFRETFTSTPSQDCHVDSDADQITE